MRTYATRFLLCLLLVSLPLVPACDSGDGDDGDATHSIDKGGVLHNTGLEDPLRFCTGCHGNGLRGGFAPSCYSCHGIPATHTAIRGGKAHSPAATSSCVTCHGPDNTGGLGPACSGCHG